MSTNICQENAAGALFSLTDEGGFIMLYHMNYLILLTF